MSASFSKGRRSLSKTTRSITCALASARPSKEPAPRPRAVTDLRVLPVSPATMLRSAGEKPLAITAGAAVCAAVLASELITISKRVSGFSVSRSAFSAACHDDCSSIGKTLAATPRRVPKPAPIAAPGGPPRLAPIKVPVLAPPRPAATLKPIEGTPSAVAVLIFSHVLCCCAIAPDLASCAAVGPKYSPASTSVCPRLSAPRSCRPLPVPPTKPSATLRAPTPISSGMLRVSPMLDIYRSYSLGPTACQSDASVCGGTSFPKLAIDFKATS